MQYLDAEAVRQALRNGVQRVIASQDGLNRINVFPVADGDTGTNMALTVGAMGGVLEVADDWPLDRLLATAADALLDGARGNSGAILAQFFQGVSDTAAELKRFTVDSFTNAIVAGSSYARDALSEPREGTILSVIDAYADGLAEAAKAPAKVDFGALLARGLEAAEKALAATRFQLAELRKADVVDAGGKGFVELLHGMLAYIRDGETVANIDLPDDVAEAAMAGEEVDLEYRFCTECIINGDEIDRRKLRESLSELGGSLVLAGSRHKAKVHIHVNEPEQVFELARQYGTVSGEKADDMQRQQHTTHAGARKVAIITDSAADIADADMDALDIHFVPLRVQFGEQGFLDKLSISPREFFEELERNPNHPTTSQPAPGDYRRQYEFLASHFEDVLAITLSSKVSGTHAAAATAANRVRGGSFGNGQGHGHGKVHVVDSRNASLGQGLIVRHAAELAESGADIDTVREAVDRAIAGTHTFALVSDLRYAVRGGRVPNSRKVVADLLNLNPVLRTSPDGSVSSGGVILGRGRRLPKFARYISRRIDADRPMKLAVGHANCEHDAIELRGRLLTALPGVKESYLTEVGTAFGVHGGPGLVVVATMYL
ncbi:MAG: DegV family protein [Pseudomonadota bacterium]